MDGTDIFSRELDKITLAYQRIDGYINSLSVPYQKVWNLTTFAETSFALDRSTLNRLLTPRIGDVPD